MMSLPGRAESRVRRGRVVSRLVNIFSYVDPSWSRPIVLVCHDAQSAWPFRQLPRPRRPGSVAVSVGRARDSATGSLACQHVTVTAAVAGVRLAAVAVLPRCH